jgi:hypothetical protein
MRHLRLLAALLPLVLAGGAAADSVVIPLTVRPGSLALAPSRVVVAGPKVEAAVVDARGSGAGWQLVVLPPRRALMVTGVQVRCGARSTCTLPRPGQRYPLALAPFRATVVFAAPRGTGMGTIDLTLRLSGQVAGTALQLAVRPA